MSRRQFNLRAIREVREREQKRAKERLADFVDPFYASQASSQQVASPVPNEYENLDDMSMLDTRRDMRPVTGPLSSRLQQAQESMTLDPNKPRTVSLEDPDGNFFASLPCDEAAGIIILGRGQNATVRINDPYIHRVHAHMRWDPSVSSHIIVHGGGENATYVNRRKIRAPYTLQDGNRIRLGRTEMIYRIS